MIVNLEPEWYYTQRNNDVVSSVDFIIGSNAACMPTSRVMFYRGNNIKFSVPEGRDADEYLTELLISPEAVEFCKKKYKWNVQDNGDLYLPPNQIHGMYGSWLDEKVTGRRRTDFKTDLTWKKYNSIIESGGVVMTSGTFGKILGHAFCVIGKNFSGDLLLADPWGNFHMNYCGHRGHRGYNISMSEGEFIKHVKPVGKKEKWGHVVL